MEKRLLTESSSYFRNLVVMPELPLKTQYGSFSKEDKPQKKQVQTQIQFNRKNKRFDNKNPAKLLSFSDMIDEGDNRFQKVKTRNESKRKTLIDKPNPNLTKSIQNVETNETFGSINASKYSTVYDETKGFFK